MKRVLAKWWLWLSLTAILGVLALLCAKLDRPVPLSFRLEASSQTRTLNIHDGEDGNYYVFLPAYARMENLKVESSGNETILLGDTLLADGTACSGYALETGYPLFVNGRHTATLWFYRSENVAAMYIDTGSGNMARIHEDRNYEETSAVTIYTSDGELDYQSANVTVSGRGNSTWYQPKKPYLLKMDSPSEILGLGEGAKWVLLANALDETNLRNKLVLELSKKVGNMWTPDGKYVELWFNGSYHGLYLLMENVESGIGRLNIDTASGDFLCKVDLNDRWNALNSPFLTKMDRTVEITEPQYPSDAERERIVSLVEQLEDVIASGDDLENKSLLDLDSWVHRYLLDEISANIDADKASSYFFWADGAFHAGPIWDYDMTFGLHRPGDTPTGFMAKQKHKESFSTSAYYDALYTNPSFRKRLTEIYKNEYLPVLEQLCDSEFDVMSQTIAAAAFNNSLRWEAMFRQQEQAVIGFNTAESLKAYLFERIAFLNLAWIDQTEFVTVQFEHTKDTFYENISVEAGSLLTCDHIDIVNTLWFSADTGEIFDFSLPITQDVILVKQSAAEIEKWVLRDYITFASIAALGMLFLIFTGADLLNRRKEDGR